MGEIGFALAAGLSIASEIFRCRACLTCSEAHKKVLMKKTYWQHGKQSGGVWASNQAHSKALLDVYMRREVENIFRFFNVFSKQSG